MRTWIYWVATAWLVVELRGQHPVVDLVLTLVSWALRPPSRVLA